jgi:hypothetical protein
LLKPKKYELNGEQLTIKQIAERSGHTTYLVLQRIHRGWPLAEVIEKKKMSNNQSGRIGKRRSPWIKDWK